MKTKTLTNRILIVFMTLFGLIGYVNNVSGQGSPGYEFETSNCSLNASASGNCSFAQGSNAAASAGGSVSIVVIQVLHRAMHSHLVVVQMQLAVAHLQSARMQPHPVVIHMPLDMMELPQERML